jgi:hypothetical protein
MLPFDRQGWLALLLGVIIPIAVVIVLAVIVASGRLQ